MARSTFGGGIADFMFEPYDALGRVLVALPKQRSGTPWPPVLTFWDSYLGGTQYTDLRLNGQAVSTIPVSPTTAQIPEFQGPDDNTILGMWADGGGGERTWMSARGLGLGGGGGATNAQVAGFVSSAGATREAVDQRVAGGTAGLAPLASPAFTGTPTGITKAHVGLGNVDNTSDANKPVSTAQANALAGKADLVGGLIPTGQLPALAISDTFTVASQAAMLALTAQRGDVAVRSDSGRTYILAAEPATTLANWVELPSVGRVQSVNGQQGVVVLGAADVGAAADGDVVKLAGAQTIAGAKTFQAAPVVPDAAFGLVKLAPPAGVKVSATFDFTDPAIARPAVPANTVLRWRGPSEPANMLDGVDEFYLVP